MNGQSSRSQKKSFNKNKKKLIRDLPRFKYKRDPKIVIGTEPRFSLKESTSLGDTVCCAWWSDRGVIRRSRKSVETIPWVNY